VQLRGEFVSFAKHSDNKTWYFGVRLDLSPQPPNQHVDTAIIGLRSAAECRIEQLITREHSAGVASQYDKQREFGARQRHLASIAVEQRAAGQVDSKAIKGQNLRRLRCLIIIAGLRLQDGLYTRQHLLLVERYREVSIGRWRSVVWLFGHDDQLAAGVGQVERRPAQSTGRQQRECNFVIGENFARSSLAFRQLDDVTG